MFVVKKELLDRLERFKHLTLKKPQCCELRTLTLQVKDRLTLQGDNGAGVFQAWLPLHVPEPERRVTVAFDTLLETLRDCKGKVLTFDLDANGVSLSDDTRTFKVLADEYQAEMTPVPALTWQPCPTFFHGVESVRHAYATVDYLPHQQNIHLRAGQTPRLEATNSNIAAVYEFPGLTVSTSLRLSGNCLSLLAKVFCDEPKLAFTDDGLHLQSKTMYAFLHTWKEPFPDFEKIMPITFLGSVGVTTATFIAALDRAVSIGSDAHNTIDLHCTETQIVLQNQTDLGRCYETLDAQSTLTIGLSYDHELLRKSLFGTTATLHLTGAKTLTLIRGEDPHHFTLIMPLRKEPRNAHGFSHVPT